MHNYIHKLVNVQKVGHKSMLRKKKLQGVSTIYVQYFATRPSPIGENVHTYCIGHFEGLLRASDTRRGMGCVGSKRDTIYLTTHYCINRKKCIHRNNSKKFIIDISGI